MLRVDIGDWEGETAYATYDEFKIGPSVDDYRLTIGLFNGTTGLYALPLLEHVTEGASQSDKKKLIHLKYIALNRINFQTDKPGSVTTRKHQRQI